MMPAIARPAPRWSVRPETLRGSRAEPGPRGVRRRSRSAGERAGTRPVRPVHGRPWSSGDGSWSSWPIEPAPDRRALPSGTSTLASNHTANAQPRRSCRPRRLVAGVSRLRTAQLPPGGGPPARCMHCAPASRRWSKTGGHSKQRSRHGSRFGPLDTFASTQHGKRSSGTLAPARWLTRRRGPPGRPGPADLTASVDPT
jgi:hypothetical protein